MMLAYTREGRVKVDAGATVVLSREQASIVLDWPTASEDRQLYFSRNSQTVTRIQAIVAGTTPSVTWTIRFGPDRTAAGTEVVTGGTTTTNTTTGDSVVVFNNPSIPADNHVWLETTAQTGTVTWMNVTLFF